MSVLDESIDGENYLSCTSDDELNSIDSSFLSIPSLSDTLITNFSDVAKNFNVVHLNAQSIPAHYSDMLATFSDNKNLHAILVSESWLKPCLPTTSYSLPGFRLIRNDRTGIGGGGVAIYLRAHIPFTVISMSAQPPPLNSAEHLFIEVTLSQQKVFLGVYYCPTLRFNFFPSFEKLLEDFTSVYSHIILMGDFNTCLLKKDSRSSSLESILNASNLNILPLNATHHLPNCTPSLLDLTIVSSSNHVAKFGQCSADAFSHHDLLHLSYKIRPPKAKPRILMQRCFGSMDVEKLRSDAENLDWGSVLSANTVDSKVELLNSFLVDLYDRHAPVRAVKMKHLPAPWLTDDIKALMHRKASSKCRYKCNPTERNKHKYLLARNLCNKACRDAQRRHIHESVENGDPVKVWKFLKTLGVGKSQHNALPRDINKDSLNQHFSSSSALSGSTKSDTLARLSSLPTPNYSPFVFSQFSECDVKKNIVSITSNAVGSDGVSRNMIIPIIDVVTPIITHIFNFSIDAETFPIIWKDAQITPIPKKSNPSSFSDYRPISILSFLSKVFERLVHHQLNSFLSQNNILNPFQSGFRSGHSTVTALIKINDDIRWGMEKGELTVLTLLDFSNAFNTVDFDILLGILSSLNISPEAVGWFHSYLRGRRQRIRIEDTFSTWCSTNAGVPQGGVLSPLLFALFINGISQTISCSYHLYADDLQIYCHSPPQELHNAISMVNSDLDRISDWSKCHGLTVNPKKTQVILVGSSRLKSKIDWLQLPPITFDGVNIPFADKVKNLGILIDTNLTWVPQICEVSRKIFASSASLRRLRNFLPTATKISLAQTLLLPILDYADACYSDITQEQLNKLERLQNFCIRFIFGLRKYDRISEYRNKLKWLPIRLRRNAHILSLLYSVLFNPSTPAYLKERFIFKNHPDNRPMRSSQMRLLDFPSHSTEFYSTSFTVTAIRLWNALPVNIRFAKTDIAFKKQVKEHYLSSILL
ncbi:hypothetical protein JYU34_018964 [Plutella xylostella]|uniref:Reverse transcriptase domain-containing protein n=1 Tax=Plutella xylostella TaxID=51655 RepID=A0ABQ7PYX4_PLUXY|nr:hypothetical protein JYU34_018964 [Plutella xylostella]